MFILLVEDDLTVGKNIQKFLASKTHVVDWVRDGKEGEFKASVEDYDAVVLDVNLPKMDGWEVLRRLRDQKNKTPILMLTAYGEVEDRVKGLNLGADDYLPKPFVMDELYARLQALLRRNSRDPSPTMQIGNVEIDPRAQQVTLAGKKVKLSTKEFAVLEYLARNKGAVVTRTMVMEHVWGSEFDSVSNVVDVYVKNLRKKLGENLIETVRGKGYRMVAEE